MSKIPVNDAALISAYIQGDSKAFETLLNRSKSKVYTTIYLIVKDRYIAEDLLQETYIKALDVINQGKYNEEGKFSAWIMRIAHNLCIDHFRNNKKMPIQRATDKYDPLDFVQETSNNVLKQVIQKEVTKEVRQLIGMLPSEQREIVMMRIVYDMSFKEIADHLNISINTALGRMRYALINLRKHIEKQEQVTHSS